MKQTHTRREKGRAVFLVALMVLSVFAMSASFAGAAAANATGITANDIESGDSVDISVDHDAGDTHVYVVIDVDDNDQYDEGTDILLSETEASGTPTAFSDDVTGLSVGETYSAYAFSGTDENAAPADEADLSGVITNDFTVNERAVAEDARSMTSGSSNLVWQGEELTTTDYSGEETVQLRERSGDDVGTLVSELNAGQNDLTFSSDDLEGQYILLGDGEDASAGDGLEFEVAVQTMDAEWDSESVNMGEEADLEIDSNRGTYTSVISSDELDQDELLAMFNHNGNIAVAIQDTDLTVDNYDDYDEESVVLIGQSDAELTASFADVDTGEYTFTVESVDTTAEAEASIEVTEPETDINFTDSVNQEDAGDVAEITVDLGDSDSGVVFIGDEDIGYMSAVEVENEDGGEVTLLFNSYLAGQDGETENVFEVHEDNEDAEIVDTYTVDDFGPEDFDAESELGAPIEPGDYDLRASSSADVNEDGEVVDETDVATLVLNERSTDDITTGVAPADAEFEDAEDVADATTERDEVAKGDKLVFGVEASGIYGYLMSEDYDLFADEGDREGIHMDLEHTNPLPNRDAKNLNDVLDDSNTDVYHDAENDEFYVVVDTAAVAEMEDGQKYDATLYVGDKDDGSTNYPYMDDREEESVSTNFNVAEPEASFDNVEDDVLQVEQSDESVVSGSTNLAPGSEIDFRLRSTGDTAFLETADATVESDGSFSSEFNFSETNVGHEFTASLPNFDVSNDAIIVKGDAGDRHSVTVHVEDADGDAVSGAEISAGDESATTDDDGKATLKLAHGDYTVSASYDGEKAGGKLTVDDDTPDEVTLTLGEEDVDLNPDDEKDDDNDNNDNNDNDNNDDNDGDDNNDDQPGSGADDDQPGFGIIVALIALLAAAGFALRRQ